VTTIRHRILPATLLAMLPLLAAPMPAIAQDWYAAGGVTLSLLNNPRTQIENAPTPGATLKIIDELGGTGWGGQIALGHRFGMLRLEAEFGRTRDDAQFYTVTSPISNRLPQTGGDTITRLMANAYVDLPFGLTVIEPYLGFGIGDAMVDVTTNASRPFGPPTAPVQLIDDQVSGFAWQAIAGAAVPVSDDFALTAQVRYLDAGTLHGKDTRGQPFQTGIAGTAIDLGVRYSF
jgi:opacity protein-like surface antigen